MRNEIISIDKHDDVNNVIQLISITWLSIFCNKAKLLIDNEPNYRSNFKLSVSKYPGNWRRGMTIGMRNRWTKY